jgi:putative ABC transport system permease protein
VRLDLLHRPQLGGLLVGLAVLMGLLAGAYPAIYLSSWAPLTALSGQTTAGKGSLRLREGLVLLQFTISAAVIASTLLMAAQMRYVANKPLGFQKENKLVVNLRGAELIEQLPTLRRELAKNSHVLGTTWVQVMLGQDTPRNVTRIETEQGVIEPTQITHMPIGEDFVQVMKLNLLEGRDIGSRLLTDVGQNFLVNEAMVRKMGWSQPLGKRIQLGNMDGRVVGVVQDFNYESLRKGIEPFLLYATNEDLSQVPPLNRPFIRRQLVVSISDEDVPGTIAHIEKTVQSMSSRHPFQFSFFDQDLDQLYKAERQLTQLTAIFATVCIFIACLGLFGLAAFTTEQRTREIGTRKVLGATTMQIILLLARRVLVLVLVAAVLAAGLAWFAVDAWLGGFAYRAPIDPLAFLLAAAIAAAIAFATVALQSWRTASSDPVHTLRHV